MLLFLLGAIASFHSRAQELTQTAEAIVAEGKMLYRSEMASWHGTDVLEARFKHKMTQLSGYFSYADGKQTKCVFFNKQEKPAPILTLSFNENFDVSSVKIDTSVRSFTTTELDYFIIRQQALKAARTDTTFKHYNNANLNFIPIVDKDTKRVFVLTGPRVNGIVIFGNDYLLTFNGKNELLSTKRLHRNIIPINYTKEPAETAHTHLPETGDFITSTDICTLMLYGKFTNWKNHVVIAEKYKSVWNCEKGTLALKLKDQEEPNR